MKLVRILLIAVTIIGLGVDAWIHFKLAPSYDLVRGSVSQGQLFRIEAILAVISGLALLIRPNRSTSAIAALVAGGGLVAVLLYRYVDIGALGPLPSMYEPLWYPKKIVTTVAEAVATLTAVALMMGRAKPALSEQP